VGLLGAWNVTPVQAATLTVTSALDDGSAGSLRSVIASAAAGDTITFDDDYTITVTNLIDIDKNLTITGSGHNVTLSGGGTTKIFTVSSGSATFDHLTFINGSAQLTNCMGANWHCGGAIEGKHSSTIIVTNSTFSGNTAGEGGGGAIAGYWTDITVKNSTFVSNATSQSGGGAIQAFYGNLTVANSTFYNNYGYSGGAAIFMSGVFSSYANTLTFYNNTFVNNDSNPSYISNGRAIAINWTPKVIASNNIITNNAKGNNCGKDLGGTNNYSDDSSCGWTTSTSILPGAIGNYGGDTQTIPLLPGSFAIDNGDDSTCALSLVNNLDQRGVARPQGSACDAGAFESHGFNLAYSSGSGQSAQFGSAFTNPLLVTVTAKNAAEPIDGGKITFTGPSSGAGISSITNQATISGGSASLSPTANNMVGGPYSVIASASGSADAPDFSLTNTCLPSITVYNSNDSGDDSLRQAIANTCANGTISFNSSLSGQTITITSGELQLTKNVTINGLTTAPGITVSANYSSRVFSVASGVTANLNYLTIREGSTTSGDGAGLVNKGTTTISNSTFTANTSDQNGGAIDNQGTLTLNNSTITGNSTMLNGGGIYFTGPTTLNNSTVSGNLAGSGHVAEIFGAGSLTLNNSILANSTDSHDCGLDSGTATINHTLVEDGTCSATITGDPKLGSLASNGGPTQTMALLSGSPAIDTGDAATCLTGDQRRTARPQIKACDMGSYELVDSALPTVDTFTVPAATNSRDIPITTFTASDDTYLDGYLITTSSTAPSKTDSGWAASAPATFTVAADGSYTLYPWVRDGAGHVSSVFATPRVVAIDSIPPTIIIDKGPSQEDPTSASPVVFSITFSEAPADFGAAKITLSGSANPDTVTLTGSGTSYTASVSGMTTDGEVILTIPAGTVHDAAGNGNTAPTYTDNTVVYDGHAPQVTAFTAPSTSGSLDIPISSFTATDTVGVTGYLITTSSTTPNSADTGWTASAPTTFTVAADGSYTLYPWAKDAMGHVSALFASPASVTVDSTIPTVSVDQAASQVDPTHTLPIVFTTTFSEPVTGVSASNFSVTPSGASISVTPVGTARTTYNISVSGVTSDGPVTLSLSSTTGIVDDSGNPSSAATYNDNVVDYDSTAPSAPVISSPADGASLTDRRPQITGTAEAGSTVSITLDSSLLGTTTADGSGDWAYTPAADLSLSALHTVTATAADDAGNTSADSDPVTFTITLGPLTVTIDQAASQADPVSADPVFFTAVFSHAIDPASFSPDNVTLGGTAPGSLTAFLNTTDNITFNIQVIGSTGAGTITAAIPAGVVVDAAMTLNSASTSTDNTITIDKSTPSVVSTDLAATVTTGPSSVQVTFSEDVSDPAGDTDTDDVTNPANYHVIETGANKVSERTSCNNPPSTPSDDTGIPVNTVTYTTASRTAVLAINGGTALPDGNYELFVCGTTSIVDLAGNPLYSGDADFTFNFAVAHPETAAKHKKKTSLPATGFTPDRVTPLSAQPVEKAYTSTGLWMEIPALGLKEDIVGVPDLDSWDISWLGNDIGYLDGTAYPTWAGNTVLTGHVTDANGHPGPFSDLDTLKYGSQVIIHAFGQQYIYEIRTVKTRVNPTDTSSLNRHEDLPWLTLVTCNTYDEKTNTYRYRTVVRAVQVKIVDEVK
jgi:LPXTG-site transpeptidase (sortase) family protein